MGADTKITWATHSFNPWIGCTKVSPACAHCYAENYALRYGRTEWGPGKARVRTSAANWKKPLSWDREAKALGTRPRVFCASLADWLDDDGVPIEWLCDLLVLIRATPHLDWLLLTKRPENWYSRISEAATVEGSDDSIESWVDCIDMPERGVIPENVWIGVTAENQECADKRIPHLLSIPAKVRFLSCEPLLGPVLLRSLRDADDPLAWTDSLTGYRMCDGMNEAVQGERIHWVIAGGESGPHARPSHPEWFRLLRTQCVAAGVAFNFKQWGEWGPCCTCTPFHANKLPVHGFNDGIHLVRAEKKRAGRMLDGQEWNEFPALGGGREL